MFNVILIVVGALVLLFSLFLFSSFRKEEKVEFGILSQRITLINTIFHFLIFFFFIGYCLIVMQLSTNSHNGNLTFILAQVLFWGAIFVVITIVLLKIMLKSIIKTKLNQVDSLTTLLTKMAGNCRIDEILLSQKNPMFLAILDIDNFKKVNDIYGHLIGDEILVEVSKIIKANIGDNDIACRFGGDEFVIGLLDKREEEVRLILNQIKDKTKEIAANYLEANMSVSVGVTFGVGSGAGGSTTYEQLMQNADKALYHVKKNGKNKVHFFSENNNIFY